MQQTRRKVWCCDGLSPWWRRAGEFLWVLLQMLPRKEAERETGVGRGSSRAECRSSKNSFRRKEGLRSGAETEIAEMA
ncbi:hypothetical protein F5X68DRAFT_80576 [Plectosphaerella plurivora]|uniref:Uncharacterized protein n=1 Tax=Plectosphaerella plurivora TaxID=936078 RepID=A0A9P8VCL5_9PEZI|nr:hypothetical protein F5X68DRAFT_80576 [Plectosphaerella plurivora]